MTRVFVAALLAIFLQFSASAEGLRDVQLMQKLYDLSQDFSSQNILPVRGGSKDKPLGCYLGGSNDMQFRSGYKDVESRTQCEWAYDLHEFIVQNGGGWDNYRRYVSQTPVSNPLNESLQGLTGAKDTHDPLDKAHVPYDKQAGFADKWWKNNSRAYGSSMLPKDWWIHDAVLDGNNLWTRNEQLNGKASADYVMWRDYELARLMKKQ